MWYRHKGEKKWIRISHRKFFSDKDLTYKYLSLREIEIKHQPRSQKQIAQWNRFKTLGDLSRTLVGMQEIVRNPLIKLTLEERQLHRVYVNTLKKVLERIRQDKSI